MTLQPWPSFVQCEAVPRWNERCNSDTRSPMLIGNALPGTVVDQTRLTMAMEQDEYNMFLI